MMNNVDDKAVFCVADNRTRAIQILESLRSVGFRESDCSLVIAGEVERDEMVLEGPTKAPEGATVGGGSGLLLGGALGWMAGIGALTIPGLGPLIAAGPIVAVLGGAAIGSAAGGLTGALIGLGFSEFEAKEYQSQLSEGRAVISVRVADDDEADRAMKIMRDADAKQIALRNLVPSAS
jgi:hypothetical protein